MLNKAMIIGNLGNNPEIHKTPEDLTIANFGVATSEKWIDKKDGDKKERTEWHQIVAFGRLGEICGEYLKKGKRVYIEGRLQTRDWEDKEGIKRYTTEIVAAKMLMLNSKQPESIEDVLF